MTLLPLDLSFEIAAADGTRYRWGTNQLPGDRPTDFNFRTKIGEGFSDGSLSLSRRIDLDYPDLELINNVVAVGADGSVAYEGRLSAMPRELDDSHSINVTLTGWMAHARDKQFSEIYVDRDLGAWQQASVSRRAVLLQTSNITPQDSSQIADPTDSQAGIETGWDGAWTSPYSMISEAWYDAGPEIVVKTIAYSWKRMGSTIVLPNPAWIWRINGSDDDKQAGTVTVGSNLAAAGPSTSFLSFSALTHRYAVLQLFYNGTPGGADGTHYGVTWFKLAVYGNHGCSLNTGETTEPWGVLASEVIKDIAGRWCPKLNTTGVQDTTYVIQHLAFKDQTDPYDAFLEINKYHLWNLAVWENRTLTYEPFDLTDYDWEVRTDDPGTTISLQGPSVDNVFNGIVVTYTDVLTGIHNKLTPTSYPSDLSNTDPDNPWNKQGIDRWDKINLSTPTVQAQALQIGRMALAESNRPKAPGTITVKGYIRDRAGVEQPGWKVRAGQTVAITNHPNDAPRLIHETSWDDESKSLTLSVEAPAVALDAVLDRVASGFSARGLV